jgi:flagellar biosynthesis protein FliR
MDADALLQQFSEQQVATFFLILARVSPLFIFAPLFSSKMIPARARAVLAVALSVGLYPIALATGTHHHIDLDVLGFTTLLFKELLVGLAYSFGLAGIFAALQVAGSLMDTLIGFSFGALVDPITGNQSSVLAQLYALFGAAVFVAINGDAWVIQGLARTYEMVPLLDAPAIGTMVQGAQVMFTGIFASALEVCAPVLLALTITDAAFGVVTKVVPQMNVFSVGFAAKVSVGLLVLGASLPFVSGWIADELQLSVAAALHTLRVA